MAFPARLWQSTGFAVLTLLLEFSNPIYAFTSSEYSLDSEFLGSAFFDGWDFFTDADPTRGFVSYYSRLTAQQAGLISAPSDTESIYIGVDHTNVLAPGVTGRPSVRITSKKNWTHGLFVGDFNHIPAGICGTWPAFWTLGPNWPYTGEIDILEGVNDIETNSISLHTNETCVITGNIDFQSGVQGGTDCAIYPGQNIGCGVVDRNTDSYSNFNNVGGGVYAMQWTSDYIRVWFWARNAIPQDITAKQPNPFSWGTPVANMESPNCPIDKHFQQHNIVFDTTFCGTYAGSIWPGSTCQTKTGYGDCNSFVAANPQAFADSYWSINSVRVYQLADPAAPDASVSSTPSSYPPFSETIPVSATYVIPNATFTAISDGIITTITTKGGVSPTHPVFNTTSINPSALGPGMGTFSDAISSKLSTGSTTGMSTSMDGASIPVSTPTAITTSSGDTFTQIISTMTTSSEYTPDPQIFADFSYAGCKGLSGRPQGLILAEASADMSISRCISECSDDLFAGILGQ